MRRELAQRIWLVATAERLVARVERIVLNESGIASVGPQSPRVRAFDRDEVTDGGEIGNARAVDPHPAAEQIHVVRVPVRRVHDDERRLGKRDVAPVVGRARTVAGLRVLPTIARAVDIEPQGRPPARRIGRDLAPAQRDVPLGPREAVDA